MFYCVLNSEIKYKLHLNQHSSSCEILSNTCNFAKLVGGVPCEVHYISNGVGKIS